PDAVQRGERAHQHVIDAAELARLLHHRYVLRLLDHADYALVARRVRAEDARILIRDVVAGGAVGDALLHLADGVAQPLGLVTRILEDVKREALRAFGADAGQLLQLLNEPGERFGQQSEAGDLESA